MKLGVCIPYRDNGDGVHIAIDGSTTSWSAHSDERLKENITDSEAGLSFINDLRPITYNCKFKKDISPDFYNFYKADSEEPVQGDVKQTNHGFVAQEVKAVIDNHPEVKEGNSIWRESPDGVQNIAEGALMPMMVKAVQELSAQVEELKENSHTPKDLPDLKGYNELIARIELLEKEEENGS